MNKTFIRRDFRQGIVTLLLPALFVMLWLNGCGRNRNAFSEATNAASSEYYDPYYSDSQYLEDSAAVAEQPLRQDRRYEIKPGTRIHDRIRINAIGRLRDVFNDSNKYQYAAAERLGLKPLTSVGASYFTSRPVVHVVSNSYYTIDSLTHSFPYLVPEAELLLRDIGRGFIDSLASRGADSYRIMVTSLLRTPQTVKRLRRVNRNAVDSSTHQFGTTFDISFTRFDNTDPSRTINNEDLKNLLAEVLLDMRNRNRCLVKYEHKGGCFHITATR